MLLLFGSILDY